MTQAFNLSQFANKVNTSGQASLTTAVTGLLPVANGGTGTATPSLVGGTNITISGSFPNQTVTASSGGVTSLNGQTGAITTNTFDSIGSTASLICPSAVNVGSTVAGSTLKKLNSSFAEVNANATGTWRNMGAFEASGQNIILIRIS